MERANRYGLLLAYLINKGENMKEIIHHLLGSCGENHISIFTIFSTSVAFLYRDYIVAIIKGVKDDLFK